MLNITNTNQTTQIDILSKNTKNNEVSTAFCFNMKNIKFILNYSKKKTTCKKLSCSFGVGWLFVFFFCKRSENFVAFEINSASIPVASKRPAWVRIIRAVKCMNSKFSKIFGFFLIKQRIFIFNSLFFHS